MPQEMGSRVEYPAEMQEAIASANAKLSVLRDETARLDEQKSLAYKEVARLELAQDELSAKVEKLSVESDAAEVEFKAISERLVSAKGELEITVSDRKVILKELVGLKEQVEAESARLSSIVEDQRHAQEEMAIEKEAHAKMKELFEARKARVIELLSSI